jgi:hypothetical protein
MSRAIVRSVLTLLALTGFAALGMGGCESSGSDPTPRQRDPYYEPPARDRYPDRGRDDRPRYDEPKSRAEGIPSSARLMEEGKGVVTFRATRDGRVFVEDTHDLKLLLETQLFEGETLSVDPQGDTIAVDGKTLPGPKRMRKLANDHRHRIYFYGERTQRPHDRERVRDRDVRY